jgi:hypothetical protein
MMAELGGQEMWVNHGKSAKWYSLVVDDPQSYVQWSSPLLGAADRTSADNEGRIE